MTSVLITGATTPLGRGLVARLRANPQVKHIIAVGIEANAPHLEQGDRVSYHQVDLTRPRQMRNLIFGPAKAHQVDIVAHTATHRAASRVGHRVHKLNVDATRLLLRLCEESGGISRFVFRSSGDVYASPRSEHPDVLREDHPVEMDPGTPQFVRDRVEADIAVCMRMGLSPMSIAVLRMSEIVCPDMGSQLLDYLGSRVCLRPVGYDPMLNLLSLTDAVNAMYLALFSDVQGVINIPGSDTLPLSKAIHLWGRRPVPLPGPLLGPLYRLRSLTRGTEFRYDMNARRFHFNGILDGARAERALSYTPTTSVSWPQST